ncbi:MAG TPA: hypothetical protein VML55_10025 [Planctomycetaceae bacterium]|nr:hypothetical protein [Planctomycetaceae bacterium]
MPARRRLTFQLTPLLDLLLIVIFAQYMEVREASARAELRVERQAAAEIAGVRSRHADDERRLREAQVRLAELEGSLDERQRALEAEVQELLDRQERVGDLIAEMFKVPDELVDAALTSIAASDQPRSAAELDQLRLEFRELAARRGHEAVKHLLTHAELRKRVDIWEIHIDRTGLVRLNTGDRVQQFRFDLEPGGERLAPEEQQRRSDRAAERFANRLFDIYKSLPQPKSVVILLFSYGNIPYGVRKPAFDGLRMAADRMRTDSNGRSRFEYATLGYLPE